MLFVTPDTAECVVIQMQVSQDTVVWVHGHMPPGQPIQIDKFLSIAVDRVHTQTTITTEEKSNAYPHPE